ncbi:MAG TPA: GNAT family N-acetyltransferase [Actinocrinis sp.]|nr:GNAT family N-acetyltransferase [Actinocrinis sp.]
MEIVVDDLSGPRIAAFLAGHVEQLRAISPPGSSHALDLDGLRKPGVTFYTALDGPDLLGCGALKALDAEHGEIKSMRTAPEHLGRGVASALLGHIIIEAGRAGLTRLSLETGSFEFFAPARALYTKFGFESCGPFGAYREDPHSVFMTRILRPGAVG